MNMTHPTQTPVIPFTDTTSHDTKPTNVNNHMQHLPTTGMGADDLKKVPHQSYRTVDRIMYAMAKLTKLDNTKPYSENNPSLNASITTILQNDSLTLEYQAVGKWLSRINDVKPLK